MNNKISIAYIILIIAAFFLSCREPVKEEKKINTSASSISLHHGDEKYAVINTKETVVTWKGSGPMGSHTGYVYVSQGNLLIENGELVGGTVEVDMSTIEDDEHSADNNVIDHLKNPDFFDIKKFPFSTIVITNVAAINVAEKEITGELTIKGITQPVRFPANVEVADGIIKASGKLVIDRTRWDIRYKSGKFFDNLKDQVIADSIEFNMKIIAKK